MAQQQEPMNEQQPADPSTPFRGEQTTWSPALFGFYASCAAVSLGAAIAAVSWVTFGDIEGTAPIGVFGVLMSAAGVVLAWVSLRKARKEDEPPDLR